MVSPKKVKKGKYVKKKKIFYRYLFTHKTKYDVPLGC